MKNAKKKKNSRKNKSSWRKHVDISDVDSFLESSRLDERIGTVADVPNVELFTVDKAPSKKSQKTSAKGKRWNNIARPLKCLAALENTSKVTDPLTNRTKVKSVKNMMNMKHSSKILGDTPKPTESKQIAFDHDLWNAEKPAVEVEKKKSELESGWFSTKLMDHHLRNSGTAAFRVPKTARKETSKIKAFELPHPGMSYNPQKGDYRSLIEDVVKNEEVLIKKDEHLNRVTTEMFTKMTAEDKEKQLMQEMSAGLGLEVEIKQEDEIKKEFPGDVTAVAINPPVERKPKSRKALRKKTEEMKRREALKKSKIEKKKISDIIRIGQLKQTIVKKEMKLANRRNRDDKEEVDKDFRPRRIGPMVFKEVDIDVAYPEEVTGNLRTTMNHGSILKDRFVSLEKRNMVVPSKKQMVRKRHKVKTYVKNTHKGFVVKPVKPINNYKPRKNK